MDAPPAPRHFRFSPALLLLLGVACRWNGAPDGGQPAAGLAVSDLGTAAHAERVMTSVACAGCHPAIYAEHRANTHGRAFLDTEARLATRGFRREDCVRCHTPRPVFETGLGITPMQRWTNLEEGNTCMSCHGKAGYDYSRFVGGGECRTAFDTEVGTVQACASCHRIAGTPDQWSRAAHGYEEANLCVDCHMPAVERPVAVGEEPRLVRSHVFPASRSETQLRRAYAYEAALEGNEVVVRLSNRGAGHNFPTATRQRAVESLVTIRDRDGNEVGRSRMVCRYPYASELAPGQLTMPVSTQIPSGKSREQRVPIPVEGGTVTCELFFKLYRPIDDHDPDLSRRLEVRTLPFAGLQPSEKPVEDAPELGFAAPAADLQEFFSPEGTVNLARPVPGTNPIEIPEGQGAGEIARLVSLLEFHLPEARRLARERLDALGPEAVPALIEALGSWSNESFNQAIALLAGMGETALPAVRAALEHPELYVRCHARVVLARMGFPGDRGALREELAAGLARENPLDRRFTAEALGALGDPAAAPLLRAHLADPDPDVVIASARALALLDARDAVPALRAALERAQAHETRRAVATALCQLGSPDGVPVLLDGLEQADDLVRADFFADLVAVTGLHEAYDPGASLTERLEALARLRAAWAERGAGLQLRPARHLDPALAEHAFHLVEALGGGTDTAPGGDDEAILNELEDLGADALPALVEGLTFPTGFADKRALVCQALARSRQPDAAAFLVPVLRDPVLAVGEWACWALEEVGDAAALPALARYQARVLALRESEVTPERAQEMLARVARTRLLLGANDARDDLVGLLLASAPGARRLAIEALAERYGGRRGYDPDASDEERRAALEAWRD